MNIGVACYDGVLGVVTDNPDARCALAIEFHDVYELWHPMFDYVADRLRQGRVESIVFLQCSDIAMAFELRGVLKCVAAEIECPFVPRQFVDDDAEARAWKALPGVKCTAIALALAALEEEKND